jgi:hypothetical protein
VLRAAAFAVALLLLASCGPKSMSARRANSQRVADEADEQLSAAERSMAELDADEASKAIGKAKKALADPDAQLYPEYDMLMGRAKEDEAKLPDVKKARELKDLAAAVTQRKEKVEEKHGALKKTLKALDAAGVEKGAVEESQSALDESLEALKDGADLEKKDKAYAEWAKGKREALDKTKEPIGLAKARVEFMAGPVASREQAAEKLKAGKAEKGSPEKRAAFAEAKKLYEQCQDACRKSLTANPAISRLPIMASGRKTTPEALDTACSAEWQDVDKAEKKIKPDKAPPPPPKKKK